MLVVEEVEGGVDEFKKGKGGVVRIERKDMKRGVYQKYGIDFKGVGGR